MTTTDLLRRFRPSAGDPFDLAKVGHLFRRTGFCVPLDVRQRFSSRGVDAAVDAVFAGEFDGEDTAQDELVIAMDSFPKLRAYRVWRMLAGKHQLRERMSFFWHDRFAVSNRKLNSPQAMTRHFAVFDEHGLGRFDDLVSAICHDPAMLRWLDNDANVEGHPNENLARELFELFTLGRGNYTERDVQEAARAFTGWHVRHGRFRFASRKHDRGVKEVLGQRGRFDGNDIVRLAVEHAASARFVARKLLAFFVHAEPTEAEIDAVADRYRKHGRHIGKTLRDLIGSELFFSRRAYRSRIKDPIDFVLGAVRSLGASASPERLADAAARMGQSIGEPPNVAGWPGERAWLNSATWLLRSNFGAEIGLRYNLRPGLDDLVDSVDGAVDRLLDGQVSDKSRASLELFARHAAGEGSARRAAIVQAVQNLPEAQLL